MIIPNMPEAIYHAHDEISKSGLWKFHTQTPAHFKFSVTQQTPAMAMGSAIHTAVLEPHLYDQRYYEGPEDRRGNAWKDANNYALGVGKLCLTSGDYQMAQRVAQSLHRDPLVKRIADNSMVEASAFWTDDATGLGCRSRLDAYSPSLKLAVDLKSSVSANPRDFAKSVAQYGYHLQEFMYRTGWVAAGGGDVDAFVFIVVEKEPPFCHSIIELHPRAAAEGEAIFHTAMNRYAECKRTNIWPAYGSETHEVDLPKWAYQFTTEQEEAA